MLIELNYSINPKVVFTLLYKIIGLSYNSTKTFDQA